MADYGLLFQPAKTIKGGDVNNKCWTMCKSIPRLKTLEIIGFGTGEAAILDTIYSRMCPLFLFFYFIHLPGGAPPVINGL